MSPKNCYHCQREIHEAYRIKTGEEKTWIFICGKCCLISKKKDSYIYGGTWKSKEKRRKEV